MTHAEMVEILESIASDEANAAEDRVSAMSLLREIEDEGNRPTPGR
jgi:hypothetical protein